MMKKTPLTLSALTIGIGCALAVAHADDLEIYNHHTITPVSPSEPPPPDPPALSSDSKPVLMLVLNIGDGMGLEDGSFSEDYGVSSIKHCVRVDPSYSPSRHKNQTKEIDFYDADGRKTGKKIRYQYETCDKNPTRVSVLKEAFLQFLTNPNPQIRAYKSEKKDKNGKPIQSSLNSISDFKMGLASNFSMNGPNGGQILYPAMEMTDDNRFKMAQEIAKLDAEAKGNNALSLTIAETMAYFSGGTTKVGPTMQAAYAVGVERNGQWQGACSTDNPVRKLPTGRFDVQLACSLRTLTNTPKEQALAKYDPKIFSIQKQQEGGGFTYYIAEYRSGVLPFSGFPIAHPDSKSGDTYKSPLSKANECAANGIYMLSDGDTFDVTEMTSLTNNGRGLYLDTLNAALRNQPGASIRYGSGTFCAGTLNDARVKKGRSTLSTLWSCAGEMAKYARAKFDSQGNMIRSQSFQVTKGGETFNADVRFASVGYGGGLSEVKNARKSTVSVVLPGGNQKGEVEAYNCNSFSDTRARNMCKLGEFGQGYGEGGFYYVAPQDNKAVAESVVNFMFSLTPPPPTTTPSPVVVPPPDRSPTSTGAMVAPIDPLTGSAASGFAYLPILDPKPGSNVLWDGNLKKYQVQDGRMKGKDNKPVIKNDKGHFNPDTYDFWNSNARADGAMPQVGGSYSQLFKYSSALQSKPNLTQNTRNVWVDIGGRLTKVDATIAGKLGNRPDATLSADLLQNYANRAAGEDAIMGAVLHSSPQLIAYEIATGNGGFDANSRQDAVIYGSMEGALHLVDNETGQELFSFVPQEMLDLQPNALNKGTTGDNKVPHGVDGPWTVTSRYGFVGGGAGGGARKYKANSVIASGGLRMGGSKYYSLDITDSTAPNLLYSVGSSYGKHLQDGSAITGSGGKTAAENQAYARMGQSWAKPSVGYVRSGGKKVMVDFLAGGYDYNYENPNHKPQGNAQGNAVYMTQIGVETVGGDNQISIKPTDSGKLLWWVTQGGGSDKTNASSNLQASQHSEMNHSVVSQIRVLDRDNDGYTDHIYYADLGGRVWRADLDNKKPVCPIVGNQEKCTDNFSVTRVVKVLDVSDQAQGGEAAPRFYERPLVTFTSEIDGTVMGMVTVGSGNRSLPISHTRQKPDAIYTYLDRDIARSRKDLYNPATVLKTQNLGVQNLDILRFSDDDKKIKANMLNGTTQGWYHPLSKWVGEGGNAESATGLKSFNEPDALDGYLFTTVYNPRALVDGGQTAATPAETTPPPKVEYQCGVPVTVAPPAPPTLTQRGVTQRRLMCLPFGNCAINEGGNFNKIPSVNIGVGIINNIVTQEHGKGGGLVGTLLTHCEGPNCGKKRQDGNTPEIGREVDEIGFDITPVLNPRDWWEK